MDGWIRWGTRLTLVGVFVLLGWNVWQAVTTYQTMTTEQIVAEQQREAAQRQAFEAERTVAGESDEPGEHRKGHGFFADSPYQTLKRIMREPGSNAVHLIWIALGFWLAVEAMKRLAPNFSDGVRQFVRRSIHYLREHHRVIGWLAFGLTAVHSLYYLALWWFKSMAFDSLLLWSGIASFVPFLLLTVWGEWLQRHGRDQKARKIHWAMALLMIVGLLVHDFGSLGKLFIWTGVFVAMYFMSQWINHFMKAKIHVTDNG